VCALVDCCSALCAPMSQNGSWSTGGAAQWRAVGYTVYATKQSSPADLDVTKYPNIMSSMERIYARPAVQEGLAVPEPVPLSMALSDLAVFKKMIKDGQAFWAMKPENIKDWQKMWAKHLNVRS
jgi:hypothetical protein